MTHYMRINKAIYLKFLCKSSKIQRLTCVILPPLWHNVLSSHSSELKMPTERNLTFMKNACRSSLIGVICIYLVFAKYYCVGLAVKLVLNIVLSGRMMVSESTALNVDSVWLKGNTKPLVIIFHNVITFINLCR